MIAGKSTMVKETDLFCSVIRNTSVTLVIKDVIHIH